MNDASFPESPALVMAISTARNNAELMAECYQLGYLRDEWLVLDPTYGLGRFWSVYRPPLLTASDIDPAKSPHGCSIDFTNMPWPANMFDAVVLDGPYKLNGTSTGNGGASCDADYGVTSWASWQDRHQLIRDGITECARVHNGTGFFLVKCQDQVCGGKVRWQSREFADHAESLGYRLVDVLNLPSYRAQPEGRRQVHARRNYSTLLVLGRAG